MKQPWVILVCILYPSFTQMVLSSTCLEELPNIRPNSVVEFLSAIPRTRIPNKDIGQDCTTPQSCGDFLYCHENKCIKRSELDEPCFPGSCDEDVGLASQGLYFEKPMYCPAEYGRCKYVGLKKKGERCWDNRDCADNLWCDEHNLCVGTISCVNHLNCSLVNGGYCKCKTSSDNTCTGNLNCEVSMYRYLHDCNDGSCTDVDSLTQLKNCISHVDDKGSRRDFWDPEVQRWIFYGSIGVFAVTLLVSICIIGFCLFWMLVCVMGVKKVQKFSMEQEESLLQDHSLKDSELLDED